MLIPWLIGDRIGLHPAEIKAGAVFLADITAGIRRHLHQPVGLRRRNHGRIEGAFLPRDGEHDALLDFRPDRLECRDARHRIGVEIERQPAIKRGLAHQQHAARIGMARGQFAEPR